MTKFTSIVFASVVAATSGCAFDQKMLFRSHESPQSREMRENEEYLERLRQEGLAENAEIRRREAEFLEKEKAEKAARRAELLRQHRANGGFMVHAVAPVCIYQQPRSNLSNMEGLIEAFSAPKCAVESPDKMYIRFSYFNDTRTEVKDVKVKCILIAPSGTTLGSYTTATIYEKWAPGEIFAFNMQVPRQEQANGAKCIRG